jgi:hypothetical protein
MDIHGDTRRRRSIVVSGPLAAFAEGLRSAIVGQGYALDTVRDHVHLLADLSRWLGGQELAAAGLTGQKVDEFLQDRRSRGHRTGTSQRGIAPILGYLRDLQVVPPPAPSVPATPLEILPNSTPCWPHPTASPGTAAATTHCSPSQPKPGSEYPSSPGSRSTTCTWTPVRTSTAAAKAARTGVHR